MYDIIIIGAGPAGLTAALYALRDEKSVLLIEGNAPGGQIANSPKLENFPTINKIAGMDFALNFLDQVERWGGQIEYDKVLAVNNVNNQFKVICENAEYEAKAVIAAVGVEHRHMNVPGESTLVGNGVYYCALCDGPLYAGKDVVLIGDGNTAMQYALTLSNICSHVYLLTWMNKFFGDKVLEMNVRARENIIHLPNTSVTKFIGENELLAVEYKDLLTSDLHQLNTTGAFIAIGQVPNNTIFDHLTKLDKNGYFLPDADMSTETPGFFVAGDCRDKPVRQVTTAVADGAIAAVSACTYINTHLD